MRGAAAALLAGPLLLAACNSGHSLTVGTPPVPIDGFRTEGERSLVIAFVGASPDPSDPCWEGYQPEVVTGPTRITITVRRSPPRPSGFDCPEAGYARVMVVELDEPLAGRPIVDGATGRERRPFDGSTLLRPRELPAGWGLLGEGPGFDEPERSASWLRTWGTNPRPDPSVACTDAMRIQLVQGPEGVAVPVTAGPAAENVEVRGRSGSAVRSSDGEVRLAWSEAGDRRELVGSHTCPDGPPLALDVLLRFAESLE